MRSSAATTITPTPPTRWSWTSGRTSASRPPTGCPAGRRRSSTCSSRLPANITKLKENLKRFEGRYKLDEVAVGPEEGEVSFGWEETGRYGGVNAEMANTLTVMCRNSTKVIEDVIAEHGTIDILKVDIETLEEAVVDAIPVEAARKIRKIYVEFTFTHNPLAATHDLRQYGTIAQFTRKGP